ncbi:molybdate ABC transporter permease subunit [Mannheimia haemolytica]|uniref:molybdate ABC transporter permease subunit n=1 Tax=Mannheimia haemolytica TaxID=75985 RepID=UPI0002C4DB74|nr:molybdate ABC transporter permease subunit [Mannheimia haemolytica]AGI34672.1 molybdate ABC transporter permease subunit [Mannheimia haemolytica USDA-ARS-USMARC-185]AJE07512.1 molybdate ABC transporter permease subunit [Mannheimia haemolytica USDA-ARS-USMARC-184]KYL06955.1 molybdate ABC transporter permease [Mannheimia haemolytica]MCB4227484.1 molybdate ABC transporter permease subunit [Mannheimia haemolytica]MEE3701667.1 molybdate ABC transporter permease subunit [Mannheimia haemolytica]
MLNFTPQELNAIVLSLKVASIAVVLALPLAVWVAWLLARKQFWGKNLLNGIMHLPLVLPPVVIGYLLLISMAKRGVIGQYLWEWFHFSLSFSWKGAVLASMVMAFPLMVRSIRLAFEAVDPKLEQAARTLGATPLKVFFTLTLPLSFSGIIAGGVLGFARSLGEFGATITFVSNIPNQTQTIPAALFTFIETPDGEMAAARLCLVAILISLIALFCSEWLAERQKRYAQT